MKALGATFLLAGVGGLFACAFLNSPVYLALAFVFVGLGGAWAWGESPREER